MKYQSRWRKRGSIERASHIKYLSTPGRPRQIIHHLRPQLPKNLRSPPHSRPNPSVSSDLLQISSRSLRQQSGKIQQRPPPLRSLPPRICNLTPEKKIPRHLKSAPRVPLHTRALTLLCRQTRGNHCGTKWLSVPRKEVTYYVHDHRRFTDKIPSHKANCFSLASEATGPETRDTQGKPEKLHQKAVTRSLGC
jgi:hypothetical protein